MQLLLMIHFRNGMAAPSSSAQCGHLRLDWIQLGLIKPRCEYFFVVCDIRSTPSYFCCRSPRRMNEMETVIESPASASCVWRGNRLLSSELLPFYCFGNRICNSATKWNSTRISDAATSPPPPSPVLPRLPDVAEMKLLPAVGIFNGSRLNRQ